MDFYCGENKVSLESILSRIGTDKIAVEIGYTNQLELNVTHGLDLEEVFSIDKENPAARFTKFLTRENIDDYLTEIGVPIVFDLLSIDVDYNTFWLWYNISSHWPRIAIIEYNATIQYWDDKIVEYIPEACWDNSTYFGASLLALTKYAKSRGYSLIGTDEDGGNALFLHNSCDYFNFKQDLEIIYRPSRNFFKPDTVHRGYVAVEYLERNLKLNLGCGAELKDGYVNIDSDRRLLNYWKDISIMDMKLLPFEDQSVQEVLCSQILEHFNYVELQQVLNEINRILKIGGLLKSFTPFVPNLVKALNLSSDIESILPVSMRVYGENAMARGLHKALIFPSFLKQALPNFEFYLIQAEGPTLHCEGIKR